MDTDVLAIDFPRILAEAIDSLTALMRGGWNYFANCHRLHILFSSQLLVSVNQHACYVRAIVVDIIWHVHDIWHHAVGFSSFACQILLQTMK